MSSIQSLTQPTLRFVFFSRVLLFPCKTKVEEINLDNFFFTPVEESFTSLWSFSDAMHLHTIAYVYRMARKVSR